jgi:hypothetical protein
MSRDTLWQAFWLSRPQRCGEVRSLYMAREGFFEIAT